MFAGLILIKRIYFLISIATDTASLGKALDFLLSAYSSMSLVVSFPSAKALLFSVLNS